MNVHDLNTIRDRLRKFVDERDWDKLHNPKNLAMALSVESSELLELFQWLTDAESQELDEEKRREAEMELADILIYLIRIADKLDIDLLDAVAKKLEINEQRYPVSKVKGKAVKYKEI